MTDLKLTAERTIAAPPERVFNAWLDPKLLVRFMIPGPGMACPKATTDPREGGTFSLVMTNGDTEIPHSGTYKTINPHSQIVFSWVSPYSVEGSTVTLDFTPKGNGTHVVLTHVKFPDEQSRDNHKGGWQNILAALDTALI